MKYPTLPSRSRLAPLALALALLASPAASADECTILDTLQGISTGTRFSFLGAGGQSVFTSQSVGPMFTLAEATEITEIGGFVNNCVSIIAGEPQCPDTSPFVVQIRPAVGGIPGPNTLMGTFVLSHDDDPLAVSFESAEVGLILEPGTYFALFAPGEPDEGGL